MRALLLTGFALAGSAAMSLTGAFAQSTSPTFPVTTRPGKLDDVTSKSVTMSIGGTMFTGMAFTRGNPNAGRPLPPGSGQH
jgi:hypothetical protein